MRLSFRQIEGFYWTARLGNMRAAAEHLNVTQPTLSQRVTGMQRLVGRDLFERHGRGLRLTPDGISLYRRAEQVLLLGQEMEHFGEAFDRERILRIGSADIFALTCLPALLRFIERERRNVRVQVTVGFSHSINAMLSEGALDIAFLTNPTTNDAFHLIPFGNVEVGWMVAADMPAFPNTVTPQDMKDVHIITNPEPSHLYKSVRAWFATEKLSPHRVSTCNTLTVIARLATSGFGVVLLPTAMPEAAPQGGALRVLASDPVPAPHYLYGSYRIEAEDDDVMAIVDHARLLTRRMGLCKMS